jgi:hypothetical protein
MTREAWPDGPPITQHAIERCADRYGIRPNFRDAAAALAAIDGGAATLVCAQVTPGRRGDARQIWLLPLCGTAVRAVVTVEPRVIVTVLPAAGQVSQMLARRAGAQRLRVKHGGDASHRFRRMRLGDVALHCDEEDA